MSWKVTVQNPDQIRSCFSSTSIQLSASQRNENQKVGKEWDNFI